MKRTQCTQLKPARRAASKRQPRTIVPSIQPQRRQVMLLNFDFYDVPTHRGVVDWVREHDWTLDSSSVYHRQLPRIARVDGILTTVVRPGTSDWLRQFGCPIVRMHAAPTPELRS